MYLKKENILVVDDNNDMLDLLQRQLKALNYRTYKASSVSEAIDVLKHAAINVLITDISMPNINGTELLKYAEEHYPYIPKLVISGIPSVHNAVNAMKSGALDYLTKPFTSEELHQSILSSLEKTKDNGKLLNAKKTITDDSQYAHIIGQSGHSKNLIEIIKRVRDTKAGILIEGESGTGKELVARAIHFTSKLANKPFVAINCGGIPENLIESELFGSTKGAYTGATEMRPGLFQTADGGTIFLDEIGNASDALQAKLLRVLQEKEVLRVGAVKPEKIDVRVICATNNHLEKMVKNGTFREDLYYRINVVSIQTLPLRERKEDIPLLIDAFIDKYAVEYNKGKIKVHEKVTEILTRYNWPGNIRELENIIHRMVIMSDDLIDLNQIPHHLKYTLPTVNDSFKTLKEYEKEHILKVLAATDYNKSKAAQILQIDRKTLNHKIL